MTNMFIEPNKPNIVYAYVTYYNESWFYSKDKPDMSDAHYTLCVSTDYGKTFTGTDGAMYDQTAPEELLTSVKITLLSAPAGMVCIV